MPDFKEQYRVFLKRTRLSDGQAMEIFGISLQSHENYKYGRSRPKQHFIFAMAFVEQELKKGVSPQKLWSISKSGQFPF